MTSPPVNDENKENVRERLNPQIDEENFNLKLKRTLSTKANRHSKRRSSLVNFIHDSFLNRHLDTDYEIYRKFLRGFP